MQEAVRDPLILNVDDFPAGRYATTRVLKRARFEVLEAATGAEALALVARNCPDLVLLDVNLPDISGFEVCRRIKSDPATARIPVLHISALSLDPGNRAKGLNGGAEHYLTEPVEPELLVATIKAALRTRQAQDEAQKLAVQWQTTFDAIADGVALLDSQGRIVRCNSGLERILHRSFRDLAGEYCYRLWGVKEVALKEFPFLRSMESRRHEELEIRHGGRWLMLKSDPVLDPATGEPNGAVYTVSDRTVQKGLEEQLRQAQKFESIGHLAAGVAHDFNNLLTSILGNTSLVLSDLSPGHDGREKLEEVVQASNRAADLTRQLLAYSGKARFAMKAVDLSRLIRETEGLLRSSVPRIVRLEMALADSLPPVLADARQIQQLLVNLVINAAEAIGETPGTIRVSAGLKPGGHVCLEVTDTGCGMDENVRSHAFDPFFTTKFMGRGLGLSAASGIVRGHKGVIEVDSAPGAGATFRILLPAEAVQAAPAPSEARCGGSRTVLVVDDEDMVRRMAKAALEIRGYQVLLAENGKVALDVVREHAGRIGAILLDMAMPVMGGEEALGHIARLAPEIKVVASTGYSADEAARRFGAHVSGYLQKPYTARQLTEKIRSLLDTAGETARPASG